MTMGDAPSASGVLPYLVRLFSDPAIIRAPAHIRYPLSVYIALKKYGTMSARYRAIGGGSPMNAITMRQAEALERRLNESGSFRVYVANRYCKPNTSDAYRSMKADGVKKLIALPLFPQYSTATTGSSFDELKRLLSKDAVPPEVNWVNSFCDLPGYVSAFSKKIAEAIDSLPEDARRDVQVLFSAHSLPHEFIKQGDRYLDEIRQTLTGVIKTLKPAFFHLCFQSKGGGKREWLKPETEEVLKEIAGKGRKSAVIVPVSFVAENIETLYDAEILYGKMAESLGIMLVRAKCLDDAPEFIDALAGVVIKAVTPAA